MKSAEVNRISRQLARRFESRQESHSLNKPPRIDGICHLRGVLSNNFRIFTTKIKTIKEKNIKKM